MFVIANYKKSIIAASLVLALSGCNDDDKEDVIVNEEEAVNEEVVNSLPVAQAGEDATVDENTQVTLTGSGVDDDGTIVSYRWVQTEGVEVTLTNADQASAGFKQLFRQAWLNLARHLFEADGRKIDDTRYNYISPPIGCQNNRLAQFLLNHQCHGICRSLIPAPGSSPLFRGHQASG